MTENKTLLLIEDDADDRELFTQAISEADPAIRCLVATNGEKGLELLETLSEELPSLIFLDLRMPRLGGKQCLVAIKADSRFRDIPVVIYTTSRSEEESDELKKMGAIHFVSKPTNPEEIYYLLSMVLEEHVR